MQHRVGVWPPTWITHIIVGYQKGPAHTPSANQPVYAFPLPICNGTDCLRWFYTSFQKVSNTSKLKHGDWMHWGRPPELRVGSLFKTSLIGMLLPHTAEAANKSGGGGTSGPGAVTGALVIKMWWITLGCALNLILGTVAVDCSHWGEIPWN